ncbi:MAG: hypothetical protein JW957_04815 [Candidatus Omnitrophica bacterium]|nr:hypothetical protein [Candidatus Omnitrophota bacterium]
MKKMLIALCILATCLLGARYAHAGSTASISVTVSMVETISVSIDSGTWNIGAITAESTHESSAFTVTNDGNVAEDISIKAANGAGGWTIGATPGADTFKVAADVSPYSAYDVVLSTSDVSLISNLASAASEEFKLQYSAPISDTKGGGVSQAFTVTLTASKH